MVSTALSAIKELFDGDEGIAALIPQHAFYVKAPDTTDLTNGAIAVVEHRGEVWDRTTETIFKELTIGLLVFANSFATLDETIWPALEDTFQDAESWLVIGGHTVYNLEITNVKMALEEYQDAGSNDVYSLDIELRLQYQRLRAGSELGSE